jgi:hypothetical protein
LGLQGFKWVTPTGCGEGLAEATRGLTLVARTSVMSRALSLWDEELL